MTESYWGGVIAASPWGNAHRRESMDGSNTNDDLNDHAVERAMRSDAERITEECDALKAMLLEKNKAYGSSALAPVRIFSKADTVEQIKVRLDDKLSRLMSGSAAGEDVIKDLLGYLILLRIATKEQWDKQVHVAASPEVIDEVLAAKMPPFLYTDELGVVRQFPNPSTEDPREDVEGPHYELRDALRAQRAAASLGADLPPALEHPANKMARDALRAEREPPREDVGFALTDAEAAEAERAVSEAFDHNIKAPMGDADWGGAIRSKLGIARGKLDGLAQELEEVGGWEETIKEIRQTLRETIDPNPPEPKPRPPGREHLPTSYELDRAESITARLRDELRAEREAHGTTHGELQKVERERDGALARLAASEHVRDSLHDTLRGMGEKLQAFDLERELRSRAQEESKRLREDLTTVTALHATMASDRAALMRLAKQIVRLPHLDERHARVLTSAMETLPSALREEVRA